jgi:hypothetical protein
MTLSTWSDKKLIKAYIKAKRKKLEESYIRRLYNEIIIRGLLFETLIKS